MAIRRLILLSTAVFLLCSCSGVRAGFFIYQGNRYYEEGKLLEAQLSYLKALEMGAYQDYVNYNLGNVYHALGETKAAKQAWEKSSTTEDPKLQFKVLFNMGCVAIEEGNFIEAEKLFIHALELDPASFPAKVNLEYVSRKLNSSPPENAKTPAMQRPQQLDEEGERLLHYIRQKESNRWIASNKITPEEVEEDW